jgi:hypothetical protein
MSFSRRFPECRRSQWVEATLSSKFCLQESHEASISGESVRRSTQNDNGGASARLRASGYTSSREDRRCAAVRSMISGSVICGRKPVSAYSFSTEGTRRCISS